MNEELQREAENNKVLEEKCQEYLQQLQKSAEIIDDLKNQNAVQVDSYQYKVRDFQTILDETAERLHSSETEVKKVLADNQELLAIIKQQAEQISRLKESSANKEQSSSEAMKKFKYLSFDLQGCGE